MATSIRSVALFALIAAASLQAQTAETIPYRAILLPANEVPPVTLNASGTATVWLHVVRDAQGRVTSASTDFDVSFAFPAATRATGLHIHRAAAGVNGGVVIDSGITAANAVEITGSGRIQRQGQTLATNTAGLDAVNGILNDPSGFYVNLHTPENPGGAMRGQLMRAEMTVLMGLMNPRNEVPALTGDASGVASVIALITRDAAGNPTSGRVTFDVNYRGFAEGTRFTGFHIHRGLAGANGGVVIDSGITAANSVNAVATGGNLHYDIEIPMMTANAVNALSGLFRAPTDYYINLHTATNPGGAIRAQMRSTDTMKFPMLLTSANEVPALSIEATAPTLMTAHTLRNADGSIAAGTVIFDVNPRFPGSASFTGLHIHNERAGLNGGVTINTGISGGANAITFEAGQGNFYRPVTVSADPALAALNSLATNPELHYVNLHTTVNPGGAVRAQMGADVTALPTTTSAFSSVNSETARAVAPYGLVTIMGTNLTKVAAEPADGTEGGVIPTTANGTSVTIGLRPAHIVIMSPTHIVAQVAPDTPPGNQSVVVRNANGASTTSTTVIVQGAAPALFTMGGGAIATDLDFRMIGAMNMARKGSYVILYATGLGNTNPGLTSGVLPGTDAVRFVQGVNVTIGGRTLQNVLAAASPGFAGLYQIAFPIPMDTPSGSTQVRVTVNGVDSNTATIPVQ